MQRPARANIYARIASVCEVLDLLHCSCSKQLSSQRPFTDPCMPHHNRLHSYCRRVGRSHDTRRVSAIHRPLYRLLGPHAENNQGHLDIVRAVLDQVEEDLAHMIRVRIGRSRHKRRIHRIATRAFSNAYHWSSSDAYEHWTVRSVDSRGHSNMTLHIMKSILREFEELSWLQARSVIAFSAAFETFSSSRECIASINIEFVQALL